MTQKRDLHRGASLLQRRLERTKELANTTFAPTSKAKPDGYHDVAEIFGGDDLGWASGVRGRAAGTPIVSGNHMVVSDETGASRPTSAKPEVKASPAASTTGRQPRRGGVPLGAMGRRDSDRAPLPRPTRTAAPPPVNPLDPKTASSTGIRHRPGTVSASYPTAPDGPPPTSSRPTQQPPDKRRSEALKGILEEVCASSAIDASWIAAWGPPPRVEARMTRNPDFGKSQVQAAVERTITRAAHLLEKHPDRTIHADLGQAHRLYCRRMTHEGSHWVLAIAGRKANLSSAVLAPIALDAAARLSRLGPLG